MGDRRRPRALVWLAPAIVFVADALLWPFDPPLPAAALLDESAHTATALLALAALGLPFSRPILLGTALGAVLIDVDHVPLEFFNSDILTEETGRPSSHSLVSIAGLLLVAGLLGGDRRRVALAAALGLATHLVRDMATGGVPLLWPATNLDVELPYAAYAAILLLAAAWSAWAGGGDDEAEARLRGEERQLAGREEGL